MDAKDIYISNNYIDNNPLGYNIYKKNGDLNYNKFINALDYSLDLIKLYDVYKRTYRNDGFAFLHEGKKYSTQVINLTFKYANREWNRAYSNTYVKFGYDIRNLIFNDNIAKIGDKIVGVIVNTKVSNPINQDELPKYFKYIDGMYKQIGHIKVLNNVDNLRLELYKNGFVCNGVTYVRWKRSSGSSRVGKCLFINKDLYNRIHKWEMCGLDIRKGQAIDLAAFEAYISLPSSSIIDTMRIKPENILVIDDYESIFKDKSVVTYNDNGELVTKEKDMIITNSIWDGQSLIDSSMLNNHAMVLLRNLFFKSCCFNCNLQEWFADNGITSISQLNGKTTAKKISDIKLITTPSSIKYLKFGSLEDWLDSIEESFGVVKYDKKTHYFDGRMVQTHYQLLNTLQLNKNEVTKLLQPTFDYLDLIKNSPAALRYHIKYGIRTEFDNSEAYCKTEVIYKMLGLTEEFAKTQMYKDFRTNSVIKPFINNLKKGHLLVNGNYSTLCGNPIEMLQATIGKFNGESTLGIGNIHTTRFNRNKKILGSRSPHVCQGNIWIATNKCNSLISKYMNLSDEVVVINSIGENLLQRLSGCD